MFCCQSIVQSLQSLISRPNFLTNCEEWRHRINDTELLCDIYDGRVWKEFLVVDGKPFLSEPHNFAYSLNIDWFQPFKHVTDSVGAIYISILNLLRYLCYKSENITQCGIIPRPKEPKDVNNYIYPIVQEFLVLWEGIAIKTVQHCELKVRAALLCITSDLLATRKICGFASHAASLGCSKCLKRFPSLGDKLDYSGFERNNWTKRDMKGHRFSRDIYRQAKTKTEQDGIVKKHGVRYSTLLYLGFMLLTLCTIYCLVSQKM